jgi:hypothetical protein
VNVKNLSIAFSVILLGGCSLFGDSVEPVIVETREVERVRLELIDPVPIKISRVEWFVITPENIDEVFEEFQNNKYDLVVFGLTDEGYENLSLNMAEIRKYIIEQKSIISAYKQYYEPKTQNENPKN